MASSGECSWCRRSRLASVWTSHPAAVTPRASVAGCDSPYQCVMACPSADRGLRVGRASTLLDPRPRRRVWRCLHPAHPGHGIRDRAVSARSPWQNGYAERLIGSIRRECLDHIVVVGERHLRHVLASYQTYNEVRTHYRCRRTRRFGVMCAEQGACVRRRSWAGYTINMFEFDFDRDNADRDGHAGTFYLRAKAPLHASLPAPMRLGLDAPATAATAQKKRRRSAAQGDEEE
jgi:hypothetical protein